MSLEPTTELLFCAASLTQDTVADTIIGCCKTQHNKRFYYNKTNCLTFSIGCILALSINCLNTALQNLLRGQRSHSFRLCVGILEQMILQMAE